MSDKIIEIGRNLPTTAEELIDFVVIGNEAVQSFKAKLRACDKSEKAFKARNQALEDGKKMSRLVIEAESRLGELLEPLANPTASRAGRRQLPEGISHKESHYAQEIYKHPEVVEQVFTEKQNDIPTRHDILKVIKHKKREEKIKSQKEEIIQGLEEPDGLFDIIVVDPPWDYGRKYDADTGRVASPYPEMELTEIMDIELPAKEDCILWLWTTHKHIWDAKKILEHWGFDYKVMLIWDKEKMGMGSWLRLQCEFCLVGVKGTPLWENKTIRDIIREPRTEHSSKPEVFYKMIDDNFVGRKLDYFGRKEREGWYVYGTK